MPYRGDEEQYVKDCWRGKVHAECYSESGLIDLTAMSFENHREQTMYGVFVNGHLAYQSSDSEPVSRVYNAFRSN